MSSSIAESSAFNYSLSESPSTQLIESTDISATRARKLTSPIWLHRTPVDTINGLCWKCNLCPSYKGLLQVNAGGTGATFRHMKNQHQITIQTTKQLEVDKRIKELKGMDAWVTTSKKRKATEQPSELNEHVLRELVGRWFVADNIPPNMVQSPSFRQLLRYINPATDDLIPTSSTTITSDLQKSFTAKKDIVRTALQSSISRIHITPDNWTSSNNYGVIGIVAHFVSEDQGLQHLVLALKELQGAHTGENMAAVLLEVIEDYGITSKTGYIMADNAGNNNTMVRELESLLKALELDWKALHYRLRCNGHVINLTVLAFLFGLHPDSQAQTQGIQAYGGPADEAIAHWRKLGPLGKLHNIVVYIFASTQRLQSFKKLSGGLKPHRDNKTRWNSWYEMIKWSLKPELKEAFQRYALSTIDLEKDLLTANDWLTLEIYRDFLEPFSHATKATEGSNRSLADIIPTFDFLLSHYENSKQQYAGNPILLAQIETGWTKLNKWYTKTEQSAAYVAAVVMDPSWKWIYFQEHWEEASWIEEAKKAVAYLWKTEYKSRSSTSSIAQSAESFPFSARPSNQFTEFLRRPRENMAFLDEYEMYCSEPILSQDAFETPLHWWLESCQRRRYPNLSLMALDLLSVPPMAADVERLFSAARLALSDQRQSMSIKTLEILLCLRSWGKSSLTTTGSSIITPED
jgi:hypothetical protein